MISGFGRGVNKTSLFWDVTQRILVVTDVAGQALGPIVKGQEVHEDVLRLLDPRQPQKSEGVKPLPPHSFPAHNSTTIRTDQLKCDGTRAETRFRLSAKRASPFKSTGASVQSTTGSRGVRISGSNAGYTMFRGSVKSTGHLLHSPVSPSLPLHASPCAITFQLESTAQPLVLEPCNT